MAIVLVTKVPQGRATISVGYGTDCRHESA
jgi:hypothetical protein